MTSGNFLFSRRLREARTLAGLSQEKLGIEAGLDAGVASARVNRYERGRHQPPEAMVVKLARALDVPAAYFLAEDDRLAEAIRLFSALPLRKRATMLKALREAAAS